MDKKVEGGRRGSGSNFLDVFCYLCVLYLMYLCVLLLVHTYPSLE